MVSISLLNKKIVSKGLSIRWYALKAERRKEVSSKSKFGGKGEINVRLKILRDDTKRFLKSMKSLQLNKIKYEHYLIWHEIIEDYFIFLNLKTWDPLHAQHGKKIDSFLKIHWHVHSNFSILSRVLGGIDS